MLIPTRTEFAGARVCGDEEKSSERRKREGFRVPAAAIILL
jgi:hypothetical protein